MNRNTEEAPKCTPILYQDIPQLVFHPGVPEFSPNVLMDGEEWSDLLASAETTHTAQALTDTAAPNTAIPTAVGSRKTNLNRARPMGGQAAPPRLPAESNSDVTFSASFGGSDGDSEYVE